MMIGIYKITNKITGKSYIGQSVHCGKRLDEHYKGNQLIDKEIQLNGISNFTFEIIRECNKSELSFWEDYYIIKYNSYFPHGYNKKWNCSTEIREIIQKSMQQTIILPTDRIEKGYQTSEEKRKIKIKEGKLSTPILSYTIEQYNKCSPAEKRWIDDITEAITQYNNKRDLVQTNISIDESYPTYLKHNWGIDFDTNSIFYYFSYIHKRDGITKNSYVLIPIINLIKKNILNSEYLGVTTDKSRVVMINDINCLDKERIMNLIFSSTVDFFQLF